LRKELEQFCRNQSVGGVHVLGRMTRDQVFQQLSSARFLVFPSECYENFPMAVVEAYSCGVPVIAAHVGSTAEIVHNGITGRTFAPGNAAELSERLTWADANPDLMEAMGRRARTEFEVKYSAERNYRMLMDVYRQALDTRDAQQPVGTVPLPDAA
jgi:glycosyltransferase involved in cell wall biosynthesis